MDSKINLSIKITITQDYSVNKLNLKTKQETKSLALTFIKTTKPL